MKKRHLFISISFLALLAVLFIQVNWILKSADMKEELFNEKAKIVLSKASEAISNDKVTCKKIGETFESEIALAPSQFEVIDSLFNYYLKFYKIDMDYSYKIVTPDPFTVEEAYTLDNEFNQELDETNLPSDIQLKLIFPEKTQFIYAEMGILFFTSIGLIGILFVFFFITIKSLLKEQELAKRTNEFLNNMTHEFKTPLTNIGLANKMISKRINTEPNSPISSYTDIIKYERNKLGLQVEQVLTMAGIEKSEMPLKLEVLDFHDLVKKVANNMSLQLNEKNGELMLELNAENSMIQADFNHMFNTICNLMSNAIKYNKNKPKITLTTDLKDKQFIFSITDNGMGISSSEQLKVFDKYYRVQKGNIHDVKGFGIGLAYAKKIIELHNGSILLNSELNIGSTFIIKLPYGNE